MKATLFFALSIGVMAYLAWKSLRKCCILAVLTSSKFCHLQVLKHFVSIRFVNAMFNAPIVSILSQLSQHTLCISLYILVPL